MSVSSGASSQRRDLQHDPGPRFPWDALMRALHAPSTDPRVLAHLDAIERDVAGMRRLLVGPGG